MVKLNLTKRQFVTLVNILKQEQHSAEWCVKDKDKDKLVSPEDRERLADVNILLCTVLDDDDEE